ncbi:MAG: hypothetical protein V1934_03945, partial [Methanobacteriota archaeon]
SGAVTLNGGILKMGSGSSSVAGAINVNSGAELQVQTATLTAQGSFSVAFGGELDMTGAGTLRLSGSGATISGTFYALAETGEPTVTRISSGNYPFAIAESGIIDVYGLTMVYLDSNGLDITDANADGIIRIDDVNFSNGQANCTYLRLRNLPSGNETFRLNTFDGNCLYNVWLDATGSTAVIKMENCSGAKGDNDISDGYTGESCDNDPDSDTHITWKYFKTWIGATNSMWSVGSNWEGGVAPSNTTPEDVLINPGTHTCVLDTNATVRDLTIGNGGTLSLGTYTLTITGDNFRTFGGTMNPNTGTVRFTGPAEQVVNVGINPMYNVIMEKPNGILNLAANLVVQNNLDIVDGSFYLNGYVLTLTDDALDDPANTWSLKVDSDQDGDGAIITQTTSSMTTNKIAYVYGDITMSGSSTWTAIGNITVYDPASTPVGTLSMSGSSALRLGDSTVFAVNGELATSGSGTTLPTITKTASGSGGYTLKVNGAIDCDGLIFSYAGSGEVGNWSYDADSAFGLNIRSGATITRLNNVAFSNLATSNGIHLAISRAVDNFSATFVGCSFDRPSSQTNITFDDSTYGGGSIVMSNSTGAGGGPTNGPAYDNPQNGTTITWTKERTWAAKWKYRWRIPVSSVASNNDTIILKFDASSTPTGAALYANLMATGDDNKKKELRILWYNDNDEGAGYAADTWYELSRDVFSFSSTVIKIAFRVPEAFDTGGGAIPDPNERLYLYYGNASPSDPSTYTSSTTLFQDGFETGGFTAGSYPDWSLLVENLPATEPSVPTVDSTVTYSGAYSAKLTSYTSVAPDEGIRMAINTAGYYELRLGYAWTLNDTGDDSGPSTKIDYMKSYYSTDGSIFNVLESIGADTGDSTAPWASSTQDLPSGTYNNANFKFQFDNTGHYIEDCAHIDDVL